MPVLTSPPVLPASAEAFSLHTGEATLNIEVIQFFICCYTVLHHAPPPASTTQHEASGFSAPPGSLTRSAVTRQATRATHCSTQLSV